MKDPSITCKEAYSHKIWGRLKQKWLLTTIWPPWPHLGVQWVGQNRKMGKIMKVPSFTYKRLLSTNFSEDWSKNDSPWPLLGVKLGAQNKEIEKIMKDPSLTHKKAFFPPILVKIGAKWLLTPNWPPLTTSGGQMWSSD